MRLNGKDVSKWSLTMIVTGTFMFLSMFLNMVGVEMLGSGYGISGMDLLTGDFSLGFLEMGSDSLSMVRYIPFASAVIGAAVAIVSVASVVTGSIDSRGFMTALSILMTVTLLALVMFLMVGASIELFAGSTKNMLIGFDANVRPMYGTYISVFSTFICGMAATYRMRECMQ